MPQPSPRQERAHGRRPLRTRLSFAGAFVLATPLSVAAQTSGLAVPDTGADRVAVQADSFVASSGQRRQFDVYRPAGRSGPVPLVIFANGGGPALRTWPSYIEWARLVTSRRFAGVLYEGPVLDPARSFAENVATSMAESGCSGLRAAFPPFVARSIPTPSWRPC